ncbi:coiled-coil domain-containing protein [Metapseudomonas boanensis]|uniref:Chromosome partitioning protein ParA n=1 Tax=Metapseudomonas boanensis TaxID=2822138 RepID=A0ABS5XAP9_9GAMM|nr:chromosome partitioning protein ParA [Pseudomonas boanensis]MBT8764754.1 chromosome partitioning protein ParA [Pseudomonas boanensis]
MSMQKKAQLVEAVVFFSEHGVSKQMLYPEFEAMLDGVVGLPEFADQQVRLVYVLLNTRLQARSAVFFYLDFDENGRADTGWNLPLRQLAERAGRGPDLGAGPIRLACRSQCPVPWQQMHLWDPNLGPEGNDLVLLRDALKVNSLGLLLEDEATQALDAERLQIASEDSWYAPPEPTKEMAEQLAEKMEKEHRLKAAQLVRQQRLRLEAINQQNEEAMARLRQAAEASRIALQEQIHDLQHALRQEQDLNAGLQAQLASEVERYQASREEMTQQLRALERHGRTEADILRTQFEGEVEARVAAVVAEYREQIAVRDVELACRNQLDMQFQAEIDRLRVECQALADQSGQAMLERLAELGVVFVVYHPGAGHLTIPLHDLVRYQDNPEAYAAAKCFVSETQYRHWLAHYQQPSCEASLPNGERCAMPIDRVEAPSRFIIGESNCCPRHKAGGRLRTAG